MEIAVHPGNTAGGEQRDSATSRRGLRARPISITFGKYRTLPAQHPRRYRRVKVVESLKCESCGLAP
jgi:hypothetical protein